MQRFRVIAALPIALSPLGGCAGLRPGPSEEQVEYHDVGSRAMSATCEQTRAAVEGVLADMDYTLERVDEAESRILARSPTSRRFFSLLGEQQKTLLVDVRWASAPPGRTRIDVTARWVHGAVGGPTRERELENTMWYEDFYERVRLALGELRASASNGIAEPPEDHDDPD